MFIQYAEDKPKEKCGLFLIRVDTDRALNLRVEKHLAHLFYENCILPVPKTLANTGYAPGDICIN
jgi:hypothetical protein